MDDYFDWYDMSDTHRVRFAKMKLSGSAKRYWQGVQRDQERLEGQPITLWAEMKQRLRDKYLPSYYKRQLLDKWMNLRQLTSSVTNYLARFEKLFLRYDIREELWVTVTKFINGLRPEIKRELNLHSPETVEEAYYKALEIEQYLRPPFQRRMPSQIGESQPSRSVPFDRSRGVT